MKKLWIFVFFLGALFALAGCNGSSDVEFPTFRERDVVELSAQEMMELFSNLEYTTASNESVRMAAKGHFKVVDSYEYTSWNNINYAYSSTTEMTFNVVFYGLVSEQVSEVRMHTSGTASILMDSVDKENNVIVSESHKKVEGRAALYFYNQSLYFDVDAKQTEDDETTDAVFKQKLNQSITQAQWAEIYAEDNFEDIDNMMPIPQEFLDMLENGDFEEIMAALPGIKVYRDGQTHSILFEITKSSVLSSIENIIRAVALQMPYTITEDDIQEAINEVTDQINAQVEELTFRYAITIKDNKITKMAMEVKFVSKDGKIDIDILLVTELNVTLPKFPTDLDTYEVVEYPGQGIFD